VAACQHFREALTTVRDLGVVEAIPNTLVGFACVAFRLQAPERAIRLFAAAARVGESAGRPRLARGSVELEESRRYLGSVADRSWREGWALGTDAVEAEAAAVSQVAADARVAV
jgi:hypothetical protein